MTSGRDRSKLRLAMWAVASVAIAAALPGLWVRATYGAQTSADEPHYLLTAISLAEDGDLDLKDEFVDERYRPFHEVRLPPQGAALDSERIVAPHDPLLPALLAIPWQLGGWQGAKLLLVAVHGVLGALLVWTSVERFGARLGVAAAVTAVFVASAPLAVYGTQVYPELPAAVATLAAVAAMTGEPRARSAAVVVVAVVALPWLAVKYAPIAAVLASYSLVRWWRAGRRQLTVWALSAWGVSAVLFLWAHLAWYGGVTPYATSDFFADRGGQFSAVGATPDLRGRSRRLVGLLVGDQFGLASWQPAYLLTVPAFTAVGRVRPPRWLALALPFAAGWLTATFVALTMQGWWFPGRQVVVVLPLAVVATAWLAGRSGAWLASVVTSGVLGMFTWAWLAVEGLQARLTLIVDFAATTNPFHRMWQALLPNYLDVTATTWLLHGLWIAVIGALAAIGWRSASGSGGLGLRGGAGRDAATH